MGYLVEQRSVTLRVSGAPGIWDVDFSGSVIEQMAEDLVGKVVDAADLDIENTRSGFLIIGPEALMQSFLSLFGDGVSIQNGQQELTLVFHPFTLQGGDDEDIFFDAREFPGDLINEFFSTLDKRGTRRNGKMEGVTTGNGTAEPPNQADDTGTGEGAGEKP